MEKRGRQPTKTRFSVRFGPQRAMEALVQRVKTTSSNAELLLMLQKQAI